MGKIMSSQLPQVCIERSKSTVHLIFGDFYSVEMAESR